MSAFRVTFTPAKVSATWREVAPRRYALHVDAGLDDLHDVFMRVNYIGDTGMAFIDGQMVDDDFYYGRPWEIGLKRFMPLLKRSEMIFVFQPMQRDATYMRDIPVAFRPKFARGERQHFEFDGFEFIPEYRAVISLPRGR
jgi:hypothetical protein